MRPCLPPLPPFHQISSRVREFEMLLGAGVVDSRGQHANTLGRMVEALALSSGHVASGRGGGVDAATSPFTSTVCVANDPPPSPPHTLPHQPPSSWHVASNVQ